MPKRRLNAAEKAEAKRQKQLEKLRRKEEAKRLKEQAAAEKKRKNAEKCITIKDINIKRPIGIIIRTTTYINSSFSR